MIAGFLRAASHNLKYVGIDALARVTRINAKCGSRMCHAAGGAAGVNADPCAER